MVIIGFIDQLLTEVFTLHSKDTPAESTIYTQSIPPPLSSQFERPDKQEAIENHCSRFSQN